MRQRTVLVSLALFWMMTAISSPTQEPSRGPIVVHMTAAKQYDPKTLTISVGDIVEWVNDDTNNLHNATTDRNATDIPKAIQMPKGAKAFNSGMMTPGKHYRYRFTVPGTYRYVCVPHQPDMVGTIIVKEK